MYITDTLKKVIWVLILICLFASSVEAAHTYDTKSSHASSSANPTTASYTAGSGATVLVLTIATVGGICRTGGAPTFRGLNLTQASICQKAATSPEMNVELWYLTNPPTGSAYTLSIPNSGSNTFYYVISTYKAQSGYGSLADYTGSAYGVSTNPTCPQITTTVNGDVIVSIVGSGANNWNPSSQTGTILYNTDDGPYGDGEQYTLQATAGAHTASWTFGVSDDWACVVAAFKEDLATNTQTGDIGLVAAISHGECLSGLEDVGSVIKMDSASSITTEITQQSQTGNIGLVALIAYNSCLTYAEDLGAVIAVNSDVSWDMGVTELSGIGIVAGVDSLRCIYGEETLGAVLSLASTKTGAGCTEQPIDLGMVAGISAAVSWDLSVLTYTGNIGAVISPSTPWHLETSLIGNLGVILSFTSVNTTNIHEGNIGAVASISSISFIGLTGNIGIVAIPYSQNIAVGGNELYQIGDVGAVVAETADLRYGMGQFGNIGLVSNLLALQSKIGGLLPLTINSLNMGNLIQSVSFSGHILPIIISSTAPYDPPPKGYNIVFQISGGTLTIWAWDGAHWISK